ncbi:hypothetical protein KDW_55020 [Dictyobacter vulcani]|uniref:Uncharacterized protein n=1 Tax=Dictyobacter vulcani TaxID=2607529 RepID=A0A5J4KXU3_9CHLR|nr:hypothetical protein [Dictyobacter vulcani]GER91340.1 hypothetical protein KDW_55020 [Dictyobacter vulcani]
MDSSKFDALTKSLATNTSRRQALGILFTGTLAGILGLSGAGTARAACNPNGDHCSKQSDCCSNHCIGGPHDPHYCTALIGTHCKTNSDCCGKLTTAQCGMSCSKGLCA